MLTFETVDYNLECKEDMVLLLGNGFLAPASSLKIGDQLFDGCAILNITRRTGSAADHLAEAEMIRILLIIFYSFTLLALVWRIFYCA